MIFVLTRAIILFVEVILQKEEISMNFFILTDVEGLPGILTLDQIDRTKPEYAAVRRILTDSINLAAAVAKEYGADKIWYLDGHGGGGNVLEDEVLPIARRVTINDWCEYLRTGAIDCQIELGAHARAGTIGGFLDHTLSSRAIFSIRVNGREYSELSLHAALCGAYDVPITGVIGDEAACRQAVEYVPGICCGVVKTADSRNVCTPVPEAEDVVRDTVSAALQAARAKTVLPMKIDLPAEIEITYYRTDYCEDALRRSGDTVRRIDARTLRRTVAELTDYYVFRF